MYPCHNATHTPMFSHIHCNLAGNVSNQALPHPSRNIPRNPSPNPSKQSQASALQVQVSLKSVRFLCVPHLEIRTVVIQEVLINLYTARFLDTASHLKTPSK